MVSKENFSKYIFVGLCCQIFDYILTLIIFKLSKNIFISNSIGYTFGSTLSYFLHTNYTFRKYSKNLLNLRQIILFLNSCFLGSIAGFFLLKFLFILEMEIRYLKFFQLIIIALIQYYLNSKFTFKKK